MQNKNNELSKITEVLNALNINDIGRRCGFCRRQRIVKPFELVMSLVTAMGDKRVDCISDLHRYFTGLTLTDVQYKPFHNQLSKPKFKQLIKRTVGMALHKWQQQILGTNIDLSEFKQVVLQDGSSFAVHDKLKDEFKGRFTQISPAAVEVHVSWDILQSNPEQITVSPDHVSEYDFLPEAASLSQCLFMADRGYFKLSYLDEIAQAGGGFLVRAKTTCNPLVLSGVNAKGKRLKRFENIKLKEVKHLIRRSQTVDMDVEGTTSYRMIASWPLGKSAPTYWATNLPRGEYSAAAVMKLYSLRWQIELLFKEWKSYSNLRKFNTANAGIMEGLIWVSLLALLVKRRIGFSIQRMMKVDISSFMVAKNTQSWFYPLMESILHGTMPKLKQAWNWAIDYLSRYAKRAHPDRDRQTGRLRYGLVSINP